MFFYKAKKRVMRRRGIEINNRDSRYSNGGFMKRAGAQKAYFVCMVIMSVFMSILAGCGGGGGGVWTEPGVTVGTTVPADGAARVVTNTNLTATFSVAMDPATIASPATSFTLKESVSGVPVAGVVTYAGNTATFNPNNDLTPNTRYTATVSTGAKDLNGKALASDHVWSFTTGPTTDILPRVSSSVPLKTNSGPTLNVSPASAISATFDKAMDPATITAGTFTVTGPGTTPVPAVAVPVTYDAVTNKATFHPLTTLLTPGVTYTATVKGTGVSAAKDLIGNALAGNSLTPATAGDYVWSFTTAAVVLPSEANPTALNLSAAANYVILAKTGVSTIPDSTVTGNVGLSPTARIGLTGWSLITEPTDTFFTSAQVVAPFKLFASDNVGGTTSADLTTAVNNMQTAYTAAAGQTASSAATTNVGAGTLIDLTLTRGVYQWGSALTIPTDLILSGSATDVWIFKVAGTLDMAADRNIVLIGGALPQNIFWQASGAVTVGARTNFKGIILGQTSITLQTNATEVGRLLAQTAVTLDKNIVTQP
jgi:Ice-binding-like/Bacterial Ig-like domain